MKKILLSHTEFIIGLLLTLSLLWPLFAAPYFTHHDDVQVIRLFEMNKCFTDRQFPCRWVPDLGGVYGYPIFNYYAPLPYYFGELMYLIVSNYILAAKIIFGVVFVLSYVFMYLLAKKFWGPKGGSVAAVFYTFAPYHAVDFYIRGAMGELWGIMLFPALFWALTKLEEKTKLANLLLSAIILAVLITSHNLSTMIFMPFTLAWVLLLFIKRRNKKFIWFMILSFLIGTLLSAFYLFPMLVEKNLVHVETTTYGYFSFTEHFKGFRKLLGNYWGYGASIREVPGGERDMLPYQIGWVHLMGGLLALISIKFLWRKKRFISLVIVFFSAATLISTLMIHPRSDFIWKAIEPLKYIQFPWRFLSLVIFFISFLSGAIFLAVGSKFLQKIWYLLIVAVVLLNFSHFKPEKFVYITDKDYLSGPSWDKIIKRSIFDYLPIFAKEPPAELATERYQILTGDSRVYDFTEGTDWLHFRTETKAHTIIRLSQYYFPDFKIFVDGHQINFEYANNTLGLMTIILGEGNHEIYAKLYDTPIRSVSNIITLVTFVFILILFISQSGWFRKWAGYYRKRIN